MVKRLLIFLALTVLSTFTTCSGTDRKAPVFRDGDIVFQDFPSAQSAAVKLATSSQYSHCGIVFMDNGNPMVWEAVQPVRITALDDWISRDTTGHYVVKRIKGADTLITTAVRDSMKAVGRHFMGRDYDIYFAWSDDELYCSEFVWKIYRRAIDIELAPLRVMGDYDLSHPIVQEIMARRWGDDFPLDEPVVSPQDLFDSDLLELIEDVQR